jgi:hypothetical protein
MESLQPPAGTMVWMGRYAHSQESDCEGHRLRNPPGNVLGDGYATTCVFGHLVLQVLTVRRSVEYEKRPVRILGRGKPWSDLLVQIWPMGKAVVEWPPPRSFSHDGHTFETLAARFGNPAD